MGIGFVPFHGFCVIRSSLCYTERVPVHEVSAPLTLRFLGVTTVLIDDGHTRLLTDGFFSRPGLAQVAFGRVAPHAQRIAAGLARAGIESLDAVLVGHSHYDHALDAPEAARRTGALLVGSPSTLQIGRGWGLPEARLCCAAPGQALAFGAFRVSFLPSRHVWPNAAAGEIRAPLVPPARASAYRDGGSSIILIEHPRARLIVQESAGFVPGGLAGVRADAALISLGALSRRPERYRAAYFDAIVSACGARRVYPLHHDDFFHPLGDHVRPMPRWLDDTAASLRSLQRWAAVRGVQVSELPPWAPVPVD